uniref:Uncharacterized protein n=1 Tax=Candidatus Kentrum sp. TUN TaxID=2126343 RepID=A0A451A595_9GAMM|nr:MAG: hypothetical protein BECKTUN1418D_GA0071000_11467 [Candidatus Kentron sp. TUN]
MERISQYIFRHDVISDIHLDDFLDVVIDFKEFQFIEKMNLFDPPGMIPIFEFIKNGGRRDLGFSVFPTLVGKITSEATTLDLRCMMLDG